MNLPGLIMDKPLMVCSIIAHAARYHTATEIVARTAEGSLHRHTFGQAHDRSRQLAHAITRLGRQPGDRAGMPAATSLPGRNDEPDKLYGLPESERVTLTCGVPTFGLIIVGWLARNGKTFSTLR